MWENLKPQHDLAQLECQECEYTWLVKGLWCNGEEGPEFEDADSDDDACEACGSDNTEIILGWTREQGWVI